MPLRLWVLTNQVSEAVVYRLNKIPDLNFINPVDIV